MQLEELAWLGTAVLAAQKVEFALYGLAAIASHTPAAAREKRFRSLTPENFLRGDLSEQKATLGQLVEVFGDQFLIRTDALDEYVDHRNIIYHRYWRMTKTSIRGSEHRLPDPIAFLRDFVERSDSLTEMLRGFLACLKLAAAEKEGRQSEVEITDDERRCMTAYFKHVELFLREKGWSNS